MGFRPSTSLVTSRFVLAITLSQGAWLGCTSTAQPHVARTPITQSPEPTESSDASQVDAVEIVPAIESAPSSATASTSLVALDADHEPDDPNTPTTRNAISRPKQVACVLMPEPTLKGRHGSIPLRIRTDLPAFATVRPDQHGPLIVGVGSTAAAVYELATRGMFVRAQVVARDIELHPKRELVFGGMVTTGSRVSLSWSSAQQGSIPVHWDLPEGFTLRGRRGVERDVSCGDLGTEFATFEPDFAKGKTGIVELDANRPLDLAPEPNAAPAAHVLPSASTRILDMFETRGDQVRVGLIFGSRDAFLTGWVRRDAVRVLHGGRGFSGVGHGAFASRDRFSARMKSVAVCRTDVAIDAIVQKQRAQIGRVIAGACMEVLGQKGDRSEVLVTKAPFTMETGASLDVASSDLSSCTIYPKDVATSPADIPGGCR